jgi:3-oxoacyl-[acyl-carrier-protein] synthase III
MRVARLAGLGRCVPPRVLTNAELEERVDTTDRWIVERTGIRERRIAEEGVVTSDLAAGAARMALENAQVRAAELDAIVLATITPDQPMPATAVFVQQKIGAPTCPAFDLSAACAGFLFGLAVADGFVCQGRYKRVLVVGVELLSRVLDWHDRSTCVLFGDGAGAAVVVPEEEGRRGLLDFELGSDGSRARDLEIPGGGSAIPASSDSVERRLHTVRMNGPAIFSQAVRGMAASSRIVLDRCGVGADEVTTVFAHQANRRILDGVGQRLGIPASRFFVNIDRYGNTSSASIPIAMSEALEAGRISEGDLLLLTALGAGVSWAAALVRW